MRNAIALVVIAGALAVGCAGPTRVTYSPTRVTYSPTRVTYSNVTPDKPEIISATVTRPSGAGPFPAAVLLHGCGGVSPQLERWARWLADCGDVGMVIDSFEPRHVNSDCAPEAPGDIPLIARLGDAVCALR